MHPYVVLDVFAEKPLRGNQLAVFTDAASLSSALMQRTARELNLSETVFLGPGDTDCDAAARIFTPKVELPFAGHPVLGAACVLARERSADHIRLGTGAGIIPVRLEQRSAHVSYGEMEQPRPTPLDFEHPNELLRAVGTGRSQLPVRAYRNGPVHVYVALADELEVASLDPDLRALASLGPLAVSCFARAGSGNGTFKTRMFAPALGVDEDPATGSAAGPLALHLLHHGWIEREQRIEIRQGEEIDRPSLIRATVTGDGRILVGGAAVFVAHGQYRLA